MKAMAYKQYITLEVLRLQEVNQPTPRDREMLAKFQATPVTIRDTIMGSLSLPVHGWQKVIRSLILGWNKPKHSTLGMKLAGEI